MFRKVKKKAGKPRKRELDQDDDDDDNDQNEAEETSLQDKIRQTQKKQKILASLPLATGKGSSGRISGKTTTAVSSATDGGIQQQSAEELTVLASKHKSAMEEFIEQQIEASTPKAAKAPQQKNDFDDDDDAQNNNTDTLAKDEEELYQQLSREAYTGSQLTAENAPKDGDTGAGGTMLAGSGIAEVILPADRRLASSTAKPEGVGVVVHHNKHGVGGSSSAVPASSTDAHLPVTTPTPFGRNMVQQQKNNNNTRLPPQERQEAKGDKRLTVQTTNIDNGHIVTTGAAAPTPDSGRLGFDAIRGRMTAGSAATTTPNASFSATEAASDKHNKHFRKNRDDQVFSNFVKREFEGNRR